MPRIRSIKPEICTSQQFAEASQSARLLFILSWLHCDDRGVHPWRPMELKMRCFPGDTCSAAEVESWMEELYQSGLYHRFHADGELYLLVSGWFKHQRIDKPTYKYPDPEECKILRALDEPSADPPRALPEPSQSPLPRSGVEWSGVEGRGEEGSGVGVEGSGDTHIPRAEAREGGVGEDAPRQKALSQEVLLTMDGKRLSKHERAQACDLIIQAYQQHHPRSKPGKKERDLIQARLSEGRSTQDLIDAIEGCHVSPHHCGENDRGTKYQTLALIVRDAQHVDQFVEIWHDHENGSPVLSQTTQANSRAAESFLRRRGAS